MRVNLVIEADVPEEGFKELLQLLLEFNELYPDSAIQINAESTMQTPEMVNMLESLNLYNVTMKKQ